MRAHRITAWVGGAAIGLVVSATIGTALAGYTNGNTYEKASNSYKVGYAAGAMDMLGGLQGQKLLKEGPMSDDAAKIVQCLSAQKVKQSQVAGSYLAFLKANPKRASESSAIDMFNVVLAICNKNAAAPKK